jgi:predicted amidophosphoribosyltransferase
MRSALRRLEATLLPARCFGCDALLAAAWASDLICGRCAADLHLYDMIGPLCERCGHPLATRSGRAGSGGGVCLDCTQSRPGYLEARARWEYGGPIAEAIRAMKYHERLDRLRQLGELARPWFHEQLDDWADAHAGHTLQIVAVPMHPRALRARGYNQAALLARHWVADHPRAELVSGRVAKVEETDSQAMLTRGARLRNLRGAFAVRRSWRAPEGAPVVLVDDVMTTGATADALAELLLEQGVTGSIYVLTLARGLTAARPSAL